MAFSLTFDYQGSQNMSLTICMVTNNYTPYSGGVVSSIKSLTDALRRQGHRVVIITLDFKGAETEDDVERVYCAGHFTYKNNPMTIPVGMRYQLRKLFCTYKPDIVHVHHPFLLGQAANIVARNLSIPVVFMHHSLYEQYVHYVPIPTWITRPMVRRIVRRFCNAVDRVIVPTPSIEHHLQSAAVTTPISVVPSGILSLFTPTKKGEDVLNRARRKQCRLLTVSRFAREKNIPWLLSMTKSLIDETPCFTLELIGYGAELSALQQYAYHTLGLSRQEVIFTERPSKQYLLNAYRDADIFVFASQTETQGLVLAEAMSQATPVIALEATGVDDIVVDGVNGYRVSNKDAMVKRINELASDPTLYRQVSNGAYETSRDYVPHHIAVRICEVYKKLLRQPKHDISSESTENTDSR